MTYHFHEEAEAELNQAITYYEKCQPHLGLEFAEEVFQTIQHILDFPEAWQTMHKDLRRCLTKRFPFGIIYYQEDEQIIILAVMQLNREPFYWMKRVGLKSPLPKSLSSFTISKHGNKNK